MKRKYGIHWILAGVTTSLFMVQFSAMAADKVVVVPLFGSGDKIATVTSSTGRVWMDRNLGATRVAGSKSDSLAYGWLYQWGRLADGHESRTSPVTIANDLSNGDVPGHGNFIISTASPYDWTDTPNDTLWQGVSGTNNPCPKGFRLPTKSEWNREKISWSSQNADGAFASPLKLVVGGWRHGASGSIGVEGSEGRYQTSTTTTVEDHEINLFRFSDTEVSFLEAARRHGCSVRCIKD